MFERLKKLFQQDHSAALAVWARREAFVFEQVPSGDRLVWTGQLAGHPFRMESAPPQRDYLRGHELRLRLDLALSDDWSIMVMNRELNQHLEQAAYSGYTDPVQTTARLKLTEEMRWLAMYREVGWSRMSPDFWARFVVLTEHREDAQAWLSDALVQALMSLPAAPDGQQIPLVMMLTRGRLYLRSQHQREDTLKLDLFLALARRAAQSAQALPPERHLLPPPTP